jgi:hypothetical protein
MASSRTLLEAKDPSDVKEYGIDWSAVLTAEGATGIATSTWSDPDPNDGVLVKGSGYILTHVTTLWLSGGTPGTTYALTNTITTSGGIQRTHQRTIYVPCKER